MALRSLSKQPVPKARLIEVLEQERHKVQEGHADALAAYPARADQYRQAVIAALEQELARLASGGEPYGEGATYKGNVRTRAYECPLPRRVPDRPVKPAARADTKRLDRQLRLLRDTTRDTIMMDPDEYAAAVGAK